MCLECGMLINCQKKKINVVPAKETNSLRDKVKDTLKGYLEKELSFELNGLDLSEIACEIADETFSTLGISEADQDKIGAKVIIDKPFCVMCPKCEHGFMTDESLEGK